MITLLSNKVFKILTISKFFNIFGSGLYNIAFIIYASTLPNAKILMGVADIIIVIPILLGVWIGEKSDQTKKKVPWMIKVAFIQTGLYILAVPLVGTKALFAFIFLCLLNIVSDLFATYSSGLKLPILRKNIPSEQLPQAFGFEQFLSVILALISQGAGVLILEMTHHSFGILAIVNAISFLLAAIVLIPNQKILTHNIVENPAEEKTKVNMVKRVFDTFLELEEIFSSIEIPSFKKFMLSILLLNFSIGGYVSTVNIFFLKNNIFPFSFGVSIFLIQMAFMVGTIIGSVMMQDFTKEWSLIKLTIVEIVFSVGVLFSTYLYPSGVVLLILLFCTAYISAKVNPRLNALIISSIPEDKLAQTSNAIGMLFTLVMPVGTTFFVFLAVTFNSGFSFLVMGICIIFALLLLLSQIKWKRINTK